ncbi:DNA excision repair protein ERCC-4 [Nematocida sp. AWRm80]|nr:DNA excision repair protein ERCC-4 [Nematocida sp. AWRm80]
MSIRRILSYNGNKLFIFPNLNINNIINKYTKEYHQYTTTIDPNLKYILIYSSNINTNTLLYNVFKYNNISIFINIKYNSIIYSIIYSINSSNIYINNIYKYKYGNTMVLYINSTIYNYLYNIVYLIDSNSIYKRYIKRKIYGIINSIYGIDGNLIGSIIYKYISIEYNIGIYNRIYSKYKYRIEYSGGRDDKELDWLIKGEVDEIRRILKDSLGKKRERKGILRRSIKYKHIVNLINRHILNGGYTECISIMYNSPKSLNIFGNKIVGVRIRHMNEYKREILRIIDNQNKNNRYYDNDHCISKLDRIRMYNCFNGIEIEKRIPMIILVGYSYVKLRKIQLFLYKYKISIRVYSIIVKGVEEIRELEAIKEERDTFIKIINIKKNRPAEEKKIEDSSVRRGIIQVDHRELRSSLPLALLKYNPKYNYVNMQLKYGDYVINNSIYIERKNIVDLVESMRSGRLARQLKNIIDKYHRVFLLIEFSREISFTEYDIAFGVVSLLTSVPNVHVLYSNSDRFTCRIFNNLARIDYTRVYNPEEHIKDSNKDKEDSNKDKELMNTSEIVPVYDVIDNSTKKEIETEDITGIDPKILQILLSIPGIEMNNLPTLLTHYKTLLALVTATKEDLISNLGRILGTRVYLFFNTP